MRELERLRHQLTTLPQVAVPTGLAQELFGAAGQGSHEEYDLPFDACQ